MSKPGILFKKNTNLIAGAVLIGFMLIFMLAGIIRTPYDPNAMDASLKFARMSGSHPFGCDNFGRDILSRVMDGSLSTFKVALGTVFIGTFFGILIGASTGYFGGAFDEILMRINDAVFAFPSILLALLFISLMGGGTYQVMIALGIAFIPSFARIVRAEFLKQKNMDYVKSLRLLGASHFRIMFIHILPNTLTVLLSSIMIGFNNAVLAEASMSFLGIGVQPPDPSLGRMLSEAQAYLYKAPYYAIFPGLAIILLILGFSLLSDGISK
ncbi:MAG: ABC transporter permease [Lachnospiraceae bacterium]|nr:ABC transporter permease [Lachnospiraceae bacterium]